ncbi:hypothetical protein SLS60_008456 [Paraconiothyrium brasiliense]|uniref:Uncharacterized protein n=1 Tax=Paraconiothyrium brasiliense TaxID=300254 RepID=A0ABR3R0M2_9PLEO
MTSKVSSTRFNEDNLQMDFVHPSVEVEFQDLRQDSAEPPLRHTAEKTIRSQLAGITAPLRDDDTSESSDVDEEASADISRWGLDDPPKSTDHDSDLLDLRFDLGAEEIGYFGEAMYGMNNRDEDGFWSQYPGLD